MALKQYREAGRTAIIIAREEQSAGGCTVKLYLDKVVSTPVVLTKSFQHFQIFSHGFKTLKVISVCQSELLSKTLRLNLIGLLVANFMLLSADVHVSLVYNILLQVTTGMPMMFCLACIKN